MSLSPFQQFILEEKLSQFNGGISSGSLKARAISGVRRIQQIKSQARGTVGRANVVARAPAPAPAAAPKKVKRAGALQPLKLPERVIKPVGQQVFLPDPIDTLPTARSSPVSIWTDLGGILKGAVTQRVTAAVAPRPVIQPGPLPQQASVAQLGLGAAGRVLPAIGRVLTGRAAAAGTVGFAAGQLFDAAGNPVPKRRRMNFGNARAARRAIRRIKGVRRLLKSIEDQLPRRPAPRRRAQHHHHPAAGG